MGDRRAVATHPPLPNPLAGRPAIKPHPKSKQMADKIIHWAKLNSIFDSNSQGISRHESDKIVAVLSSYIKGAATRDQCLDRIIDGEHGELSFRPSQILDDCIIEVGAKFLGEVRPAAIGGIFGGLNRGALIDDGWSPGMVLEFTVTGYEAYPYETVIGSTERTFKKHEVLAR